MGNVTEAVGKVAGFWNACHWNACYSLFCAQHMAGFVCWMNRLTQYIEYRHTFGDIAGSVPDHSK